ncbi:MAG: hypothetical protein OEY28_12510, partial [Nitrospira sp.]|nr:hypothetical protein [Nitrospira sp.]
IWFIAKADTWMSFRKRHIKANDSDYYLPQLGQLDLIEDRDRVEWESAIVYGGATGIGFDLMFMREATRLHLQFLARPYNVIRFRDGQGVSTGFEFVMRTADYELSDQFGLYFEASVQGFLPIDREFNDIYYSQFSIGFRFR